jgi:hypothetical protein
VRQLKPRSSRTTTREWCLPSVGGLLLFVLDLSNADVQPTSVLSKSALTYLLGDGKSSVVTMDFFFFPKIEEMRLNFLYIYQAHLYTRNLGTLSPHGIDFF